MATDIAVNCFAGSLAALITAIASLLIIPRHSEGLMTFLMMGFWLLLVGSSSSAIAALDGESQEKATAILGVNAALIAGGLGPRLATIHRRTATISRHRTELKEWFDASNGDTLVAQPTKERQKKKTCRLELHDSAVPGFIQEALRNGKRYRFGSCGDTGYWPWVFCLRHRYVWTFRLEILQVDDRVVAKAVAEGECWYNYDMLEGRPRRRKAEAEGAGTVTCLDSNDGCMAFGFGAGKPSTDNEYQAYAHVSASNSQTLGAVLTARLAATVAGHQAFKTLSVAVTTPDGTQIQGPEMTLPDNAKATEAGEGTFLFACHDS